MSYGWEELKACEADWLNLAKPLGD